MRKLVVQTLMLVLFFASVVVAQVAPEPAPDIKAVGVAAITGLTPVLSVLVLWALKVAWSKIPASIVLFAAPVVGMLINYATSYLTGHVPTDPLAAAALGALAVYLREFGSTLAAKGFAGAITPTKLSF
jgi:membrane-associated phospholipid phosphatase